MAILRPPDFLGRTSEQDQFDALVQKVRAGESAALVVRGEAGIGKTSLLDRWVRRISGFRVARIGGVESEMELPFAGLHQLCAPMMDQMDPLPDPQRSALRVAFGLESGAAPDRFLVGLATLGLLAEVARKRALLCVVDDVQWLDAASGQVLGFVARRILAESVLMVFAIREPSVDQYLTGLPEMTLAGLADDDARALLSAATPGGVDADVRDRIVAETRGNPLALLELPRGMTRAELAGGFVAPSSTNLLGQLEEHFLRRFDGLPETTRRLLLIAVADPTGDVGLLWRAARRLGMGREVAAPADDEQLVEFGTTVRFRHPLVRSAIYTGATAEERRAAHLALAESTDAELHPDRRAWHLASAAAGPDEAVASELERSAGRAQSRGGLAAAAAFLLRAVALTEDPRLRVERALTAAQAHIRIGALGEASRLLSVAEIDAQDELQRARIDLMHGRVSLGADPRAVASALLLQAARRLEPLDIGLARETYLDAWIGASAAGPFAAEGQLAEICAAALAAPAVPGPPRPSDLLLEGYAKLDLEGRAAALPVLREAVAAFVADDRSLEKTFQWSAIAGRAAGVLWDFEHMDLLFCRPVAPARSAGALVSLCFSLSGQVLIVAWRGELAAATALAAEADALAQAVGIRFLQFGTSLLAGLIGDENQSTRLLQSTIDRGTASQDGTPVQIAIWANAILANGLARYDAALSWARQAVEVPAANIAAWALPELVEAAVRTGDNALAADGFERLAETVRGTEGDWGRGMLARTRALVSADAEAENHYREAIEALGNTPLRPELARAHLLYGEWLRRQKRRADARAQLRQAGMLFDEMGMVGFALRAGRELRATGETVRKRRDDTRNDLTPQEEQIAYLALDGRTAHEIGAQLFISSRTVEWHLRKVFAKLGIASRRGLRDVLPARTTGGAGG